MKKRVFGRKFSRARKGRNALLGSLAREFVLQGQMTTTLARAKTLKPLIDSLVTKAKKKDLANYRSLVAFFGQDKNIVHKLGSEVNKRFDSLSSGFIKSVGVGVRIGDGAKIVRMQWSKEPKTVTVIQDSVDKKETA